MSAKTKIHIPNETTSNSVGSNDIYRVISSLKGFDEVEIIRNGSWGAFWLEPFIEVEKDENRKISAIKPKAGPQTHTKRTYFFAEKVGRLKLTREMGTLTNQI